MAVILNIETSTKNCSVSLSIDGITVSLIEEADGNYAHGEKLNSFIERCLDSTDYKFKDLEAISVSKGPGSYTGLRIGVSSAKGLAYGLGIKLLSIDTMSILAHKNKDKEYDFIIPMIDARRMEVYTATFDRYMNKKTNTEAKVIDSNSFLEMKGNVLLIGDGVEKCKETLKESKFNFQETYPSANEMSIFSEEQFALKQFEDVVYFEPYYLKNFISTGNKN